VFVPAHERVLGGKTVAVDPQSVSVPDLVWQAKGHVMRLPRPLDYVVVRVVE
jgi:hypothetical protein